jgi:hypothetical protein
MDHKSFAKQCGVVPPSAGAFACSRSIAFGILSIRLSRWGPRNMSISPGND